MVEFVRTLLLFDHLLQEERTAKETRSDGFLLNCEK
jgi:hypothetical protein